MYGILNIATSSDQIYPQMKMQEMKKRIGELLFQIIPVMIGVYFGFLTSNWSDSNQKKKQSKVLVANIISEMEANEKRLRNVIEYHVMLRDSSRFYSRSQVEISRASYFKGTRVVKLTSSAYDTGIQTGIVNELPMSKIQAINHLYTFQKDYNEYGNLMMASLINKDFSNREEDLRKIARFLSITMTDVVIKENELMESYKQVKDKLTR